MIEENSFLKTPPSSGQEGLLTPDQRFEKLKDPNFLPTREDIRLAFLGQNDRRINFFAKTGSYELLNKEFIEALGSYLIRRLENYITTEELPVTILEAGAGDGRLSHFLQQELDKKLSGKVKVVATDSGEWQIAQKTAFQVDKLDYKEALKKYNPKIVLCSWMPPYYDFSADFRATESVDEYILIGETDEGCCGRHWETWGYAGEEWQSAEDLESLEIPKEVIKDRTIDPPYVADGFDREFLDEVSKQQFCKSDDLYILQLRQYKEEPHYYSQSRTVSFKRKK